MLLAYDIQELVPYINWVYFFYAWQVKNDDEKAHLRQEAEAFLTQWEGRYRAYGLFELFEDPVCVSNKENLLSFVSQILSVLRTYLLPLTSYLSPLNSAFSPLPSPTASKPTSMLILIRR